MPSVHGFSTGLVRVRTVGKKGGRGAGLENKQPRTVGPRALCAALPCRIRRARRTTQVQRLMGHCSARCQRCTSR